MIIVAHKHGQLANRMFLFGHLIGFARANNLLIVNSAFDEYASYFMATGRDLLCRFPPSLSAIPATIRMRRKFSRFVLRLLEQVFRRGIFQQSLSLVEITWAHRCDLSQAGIREAARCRNLVLLGWGFRDQTSFNQYAADIRGYFTPIPVIRQNVKTLIEGCRRQCELLVGVHLRHGDYREFHEGLYHFENAEYEAVMSKLKALLPDKSLMFLLCSNEPISEEVFRNHSCRFGTNHLVEDMYALAGCDYLIGPPSTFSMWSSFYGEVPLYQMRHSQSLDALHQFLVCDGHCDFSEDLVGCSDFVLNSKASLQ